MSWITPITDRTQADVDEAFRLKHLSYFDDFTPEEKTKWDAGLKGAFNRSDYDRISGNITEVCTRLHIPVVTMPSVSILFPTSAFTAMRSNLVNILAVSPVYDDCPALPELPFNTFEKINAVERILLDAYTISINNVFYDSTDSLNAGETVGLVL